MGVLNDAILKIPGRYNPMTAATEGAVGQYVIDKVTAANFDPTAKNLKSEDIPRGVFKTKDGTEYNVTIFSMSSQMLLKDIAKAEEVKKDVVTTKKMYSSDAFESIHDFLKHQDVKEGETPQDVSELKFRVVANIPMVDTSGNQVYPPAQYKGADVYFAKNDEIRADGDLDNVARSRAYQNARKALYASGYIANLDTSTAIKYPVLAINS